VCPTCGKIREVVRRRKTTLCYSCSAKLINKNRLKNSWLKGEENPNWKGGKTKDGAGYIQVIVYPDSPFYKMVCKSGSRVREHRLVMAKFLGRSLTQDEHVHHRNGDKQDNRIENLQLMFNYSHYPTLHLKELQGENARLKEIIIELKNEIGGRNK